MITIRSFRSKILLALLAVALIPAGITVVSGTVVLGEIVSTSRTAGPWQSVADSGRDLLDAIAAAEQDPAVERAARRHREALSESVRLSRVYAFVADRFLTLLPFLALGTVLAVGLVSFFTARFLAAVFSEPIRELVGWTERIAREEPLPSPDEVESARVREFEQLRDALRSMAAELEEGRRRAVESARLRSWTRMARGVAHELKNPLTPMRMAARTVSALDDSRATEAGTVLLEEIDRLDQMARSFSRLGRMPEGPTARVRLDELLEEVARLYDEEPVEVVVETPPDLPPVRGWYDALLRIFRNLVGNAYEAVAGAGGGRVRLTAAVAGGRVTVSVRDTGPGIPDDVLGSIWDPDFSTRRDGTGLGLTLVRQAVRAHGGTVEARNPDDGGAEFRVVLPIDGPPERAERTRSPEPRRRAWTS